MELNESFKSPDEARDLAIEKFSLYFDYYFNALRTFNNYLSFTPSEPTIINFNISRVRLVKLKEY